MIVPKIAGVIGLLTLPAVIMSSLIFIIVLAYAIGYIINRPIAVNNRWQEYGFLGVGAYISRDVTDRRATDCARGGLQGGQT